MPIDIPDQVHECLLQKVVRFECKLVGVEVVRHGAAWSLAVPPRNELFKAEVRHIPIAFCPWCKAQLALEALDDALQKYIAAGSGKPPQ